MGKTRRAVLRHKEEKDGESKRLKNIIRRLESDKRKLLSELKTLEEAFEKNIEFLKGKVDEFSLDELLKAANDKKNIKQIKAEQASDPEQKWKCRVCASGCLHYIPITRHDGDFYMRSCSNKKCNNRTPLKKMREGVDTYNGK